MSTSRHLGVRVKVRVRVRVMVRVEVLGVPVARTWNRSLVGTRLSGLPL